jgi:DNA-binding NarL/FixJ family response regulator
MNSTINILVVSRHEEDQKHILAALPEQMGFFIAGMEKDEASAIIKTERLKPDVIILDLQLSNTTGPNLVSMIKRRSPSTAIIILCDKDAADHEDFVLNSGVSGFLLKDKDMDKLAYIVKLVNLKGNYINDLILSRILNEVKYIKKFPGQLPAKKPFANKSEEKYQTFFSPTERNIVTQMAQGHSDAEIAQNLNYSEGTIKNCLAAIKRKTNLNNRTQIVAFSLVFGLIQLNDLEFEIG